jgi:hypothetical protein
MVDFGEKILKNLDIILSKINISVKIINDIKSIDIIKSESLSLSKMIYSKEGELLLLSQYVNDFYKSSPPISDLNEEFITTKEKVNNHGFSDKILGAWSKYRQLYNNPTEGEINVDYLDRLESNFHPLIFKNAEVIKFFNEEINSLKTIYNKYNRKLGQVYSDDFIAEDGVFDTSSTEILYRMAKPKFDSILFDAFAFIDLILFVDREILDRDNFTRNLDFKSNTFYPESKNNQELFGISREKLIPEIVFGQIEIINTFDFLVEHFVKGYKLSEFSQILWYLEEKFDVKIVHKNYTEYIKVKFKDKISIKSQNSFKKIEQVKDNVQKKINVIIQQYY